MEQTIINLTNLVQDLQEVLNKTNKENDNKFNQVVNALETMQARIDQLENELNKQKYKIHIK